VETGLQAEVEIIGRHAVRALAPASGDEGAAVPINHSRAGR